VPVEEPSTASKADICTAAKRDAVRKIKTIIWKAPETEDFNSLVV
jgi:hypothetical protein